MSRTCSRAGQELPAECRIRAHSSRLSVCREGRTRDKFRRSGEPVTHPLSVSHVIGELSWMPTRSAPGSYDCVEDTSATVETSRSCSVPRWRFSSFWCDQTGQGSSHTKEEKQAEKLPQDAAGDGARYPRHPDQTGRPHRQHADSLARMPPDGRSASRARPSRSTRRSPTAWVSSGSETGARRPVIVWVPVSQRTTPRSPTNLDLFLGATAYIDEVLAILVGTSYARMDRGSRRH